MKIKYGIDLGTTNSAISQVTDGNSVIIKNPAAQDTTPSCVAFTQRKAVKIGLDAINFSNDARNGPNSFIEFKRTMGTEKKYYSSNMEKDYSS